MKLLGGKYYIKYSYQKCKQAWDTYCYKKTWGGDKYISYIVSDSSEMDAYKVQTNETTHT